MEIEKGAQEICCILERALKRKEGALIGRNGTIELETLLFRLCMATPLQQYPLGITRRIELHAGVFPTNYSSLERWVFQTVEAIRNTDVLVAGWYQPLAEQEEKLLDTININSPRIPLRSLEPYYVEPTKRWTQFLAGQKVAIVNAFAETACEQVAKREEIWPVATNSLLPSDVEWIPIVTGYAPALAQGRAEWPSGSLSWDTCVHSIVKKVVESGCRVALIGCGALGMVIGMELKKRGIVAVVMGGALQVLFGIKGKRWETHSVISNFWNDAWVYPKEKETPNGASLIEGGCYWGKN